MKIKTVFWRRWSHSRARSPWRKEPVAVPAELPVQAPAVRAQVLALVQAVLEQVPVVLAPIPA
jgi:hypothetical protein